jgi:hypothetical protein
MSETQNIDTSADTQHEHEPEIRMTSSSLRAAAIEAAYILEAVRK